MNIFKGLRFKIIVPPFLMFLVIIIMALVFGNYFFKTALDQRVLSKLEEGNIQFKESLKKDFLQLEKTGKLVVSMNSVVNTFEYCNTLGKETDTCVTMFSNRFNRLDASVDADMAFFMPSGRLLHVSRSSLMLTGKTILLFRQVVNTGVSIQYMGDVAGEMRLVSLHPILNDSRRVLGVVVISKTLKSIASNLYLSKNESLIISNGSHHIVYSSLSADDVFFTKLEKEFVETEELKTIENYKGIKLELYNRHKEDVATVYLISDVSKDQAFLGDLLFYLLLFSLGTFLVGGLIYAWGIYSTLLKPVKLLWNKILELSKGKISDKLDWESNDELGDIGSAVNELIDSQKKTASFAAKIGNGEFDDDFEPLSEEDVLGIALIEMKNNLLTAKQTEEKQQIEASQRRWAAEGLAKFGEILRQNNNNIQALSDNIIRELVHYVDVVQGGLFIINDDDKENIVLDLISAYAYNRKKFMEKQIGLGEGLVGTCAIEKLPVYLTDVPDDYVEITSGLGDANPRAILLMPLKLEEEMFGVIELAAFTELEDYKRDFVEKLSESIASTLNAVKVNIRTTHLLEQSQQQAEELSAQEEEMRQNMEEMQAIQEEARRREEQLMITIQAIDNVFGRMELDSKKRIRNMNERIVKLLGYTQKALIGKTFVSILKESQMSNFELLWSELESGAMKEETFIIKTKKGEEMKLSFVFSPILKDEGSLDKVVVIQKA